jgi:tetratricopeptide (TPR) repeat protein
VFLVFPFENSGRSGRYDWLGEGLEELTIERLSNAGLVVFSREERLAALERYGLPAAGAYSRAMMFHNAEDVDADFVLFGDYTTDGKTLHLDARLLRIHRPALLPPVTVDAPLDGLLGAHSNAIWRLVTEADPGYPLSLAEFTRRQRPLRLDAFEYHIRGLLAQEDEQKIHDLSEAERLDPGWSEPAFALSEVYFARRDCDDAVSWLARIPSAADQSLEAGFLTGVCDLFQDQPGRAATVFQSLKDRLDRQYGGAYELPEILNDLAVAQGRFGMPTLSDPLLESACRLDPDDSDYNFNLALAKVRENNPAAAVTLLRQVVAREPEDREARALLVTALERSGQQGAVAAESTVTAGDSSGKPVVSLKPEVLARLDRVKTHLDSSILKLAAASGPADAGATSSAGGAAADAVQPSHARRARQLLTAGKLADAEREFRAATAENPNDAAAHRGLAEVYRRQGRSNEAIAELHTSLDLRETAVAYADLGRLYLEEQKPDLARTQLERALQLAPGYAPARQLLQRLSPPGPGGKTP